ncbi:kinase-like protein, partial [Schizopora paradoxa]
REVRLWSKLEHPNILPLLGFFLDGPSSPNLVSRWMKNGTLTKYLQDRPLDAMEICNMISGVASGLIYLHAEGIIHSDLKGSNILVSDDDRPLLADFGTAISLTSRSLAATEMHGQKGTLRYMAKELFAQDNFTGHTEETDIWAFGMVIYVCFYDSWLVMLTQSASRKYYLGTNHIR